jgi:hypothetical protein
MEIIQIKILNSIIQILRYKLYQFRIYLIKKTDKSKHYYNKLII